MCDEGGLGEEVEGWDSEVEQGSILEECGMELEKEEGQGGDLGDGITGGEAIPWTRKVVDSWLVEAA